MADLGFCLRCVHLPTCAYAIGDLEGALVGGWDHIREIACPPQSPFQPCPQTLCYGQAGPVGWGGV